MLILNLLPSLHFAIKLGYSADNIAFGQGGALLQIVNRDDQKFAFKCSAACVNGEWIDVFKDPITDAGKRSKRGRLSLYRNDSGEFYTFSDKDRGYHDLPDMLEEVYRNGNLVRFTSFDEIRERAAL